MRGGFPVALRRVTTYGLSVALSTAMLALALSAWADEPAEQPLFTIVPADADAAVLDAKQKRVLARIQNSMAVVKDQGKIVSQIVRLNPMAAGAGDAPVTLTVPLPKSESAKFRAKWSKSGEGSWQARVLGDTPQHGMALTLTNKSTVGLIYTDKKVYSVEPLGNGLQVVTQIDQRKFKDDHPNSFKQIEGKQAKADAAPAAAAASPYLIRVLVAYTPKVESLQTSMTALVQGAVDIANTSYANSNINLRLELAGDPVRVDYVESPTHEEDLANFQGKADGKMDEIHGIRAARAADVCVLLIDNDAFCGLAAAILADKDSAFAVVHHECAVGNLSFAHEIGHLQGARHNLEVDPTIDPSTPWNHGFLSSQDWRTVMAYPTAAQPNRIPYWSNPDVKYGNPPIPTGTVDKQNNARMLNLTAKRVSEFFP